MDKKTTRQPIKMVMVRRGSGNILSVPTEKLKTFIRKRALLNHFGSARAVESASLDEIKSVEGVEDKVAKKIYNFFHE